MQEQKKPHAKPKVQPESCTASSPQQTSCPLTAKEDELSTQVSEHGNNQYLSVSSGQRGALFGLVEGGQKDDKKHGQLMTDD